MSYGELCSISEAITQNAQGRDDQGKNLSAEAFKFCMGYSLILFDIMMV